MNSFCVGFLAVLTVFSGSVFSKSTHERFYQLFKAEAPFPQILGEVFDNDPATQLEHLQAVEQHIQANDRYAPYAKQLKTQAQNVLEATLREIGYSGKVDLAEFMQTTYNLANGQPAENPELERAVKLLMQRKQQLSEAPEAQKKAKLDQLMNDAHHGENNLESESEDDNEQNEQEEESPIRRSIPVSARPSSKDDFEDEEEE